MWSSVNRNDKVRSRQVTSRLHLLAKARTNQRPATLGPASLGGGSLWTATSLRILLFFSLFLFPKEAVEPGNGTCKEGCNGERNGNGKEATVEGKVGGTGEGVAGGIDTEYS